MDAIGESVTIEAKDGDKVGFYRPIIKLIDSRNAKKLYLLNVYIKSDYKTAATTEKGKLLDDPANQGNSTKKEDQTGSQPLTPQQVKTQAFEKFD